MQCTPSGRRRCHARTSAHKPARTGQEKREHSASKVFAAPIVSPKECVSGDVMRPDSASCDLLIVGASFAGLVAARTAAMRRLDVVVLEAKPDAGARVATTGILVKEAAEEIDLPHELTRRVHGVRLHAPNLRHIDLFS